MKKHTVLVLTIINSVVLIILSVVLGYHLFKTPSPTEMEMAQWREWYVAENARQIEYMNEVEKQLVEYVDKESQENVDFVNQAISDFYKN